MRVLNGITQFFEQRDSLPGRQPVLFAVHVDRQTIDIFRHEVRPAVVELAGIDQCGDVRVLQCRENLQLRLEMPEELTSIEFSMDDLDGYVLLELTVRARGKIHLTHATTTDQLVNATAPSKPAGWPTMIPPRWAHVAGRLARESAHTAAHGELPLCGKAGTVNLVNFDTWHRATANRSDKMRYMLKFQFTRMGEPATGPSWNSMNPRWQGSGHDTDPALSEDVWNWLCGCERAATTPDVWANGSLPRLLAALRASDEAVCLHAAYALAAMGAAVVPALVEVLREEAPARSRHNAGRSRANPAGGNPSELYAAHALSVVGSPAVAALSAALHDDEWAVRAAAADTLGNIGARAKPAVPALLRALQDESMWVRRNALEALGTIGCASGEGLTGMLAALQDADHRVRRNAAIALSKIARPAANEAVPGLLETLLRDERYVSFYAATALGRIGTRAARDALVDALPHADGGIGFAVTAALQQIDGHTLTLP